MEAKRWQEIKRIYESALELAPESRSGFLDEKCAGDKSLRQQVESFLECRPAAEEFLKSPAFKMAAPDPFGSNESRTDLTGSTLLHYSVMRKIGEGGMGEVYQAQDLKLNRQVALKILPDSFAYDPERLARFDREAKLLASLNHSNIAAIYGLEEAGEKRFLVLELVEGETLAQRIARGPLPMDEALEICHQIAEGVEAAHERGVIHRDLKPANIKVNPEGKVKILDFGLAKAFQGEAAPADTSKSPTLTNQMTRAGVILGTAAYMSPEQAQGKPVDRRTDIWAFGCVLYECLTGERAFGGETVTEALASILRSEPNWKMLPQETSASVRNVLQRCLQKDPKQRIRDVADAWLEIAAAPVHPAVAHRRIRERLAWTAAAVLLLGLLISLPFTISYLRQKPPAEAVAVRFAISAPEKATFGPIAVSTDGRSLVFGADVEGKNQLWLRPLGSDTERPLPGTEDVTGYPFWSPDSRSIGFLADGKLKKMDLADMKQQTLCNVPGTRIGVAFGGTWNREGTILFSGGRIIYRVPASGGEPTPVPGLDQPRPGVSYRWPSFMPDGRHFLYLVMTANQGSAVYLASLDGKETKRLLAANSSAIYAAWTPGGGYLLFARQGALFAQPFDAASLALTGEPFHVADQVRVSPNSRGNFSVSDNATLIYDPRGDYVDNQQLEWIDRAGKLLGPISAVGSFSAPSLSPDGKRVAVECRDPKTRTYDIYVIDLERGSSRKLTFDSAGDIDPIWSPDGSSIVWASNRGGTYELYQKPASGAWQDELLFKSDVDLFPTHWSADRRFILYERDDPKTKFDVWVRPLEGDRKAFPLLSMPSNERWARFSPDTRWIAYAADESGEPEVYVRTLPASGGRWQVSTKGGSIPQWRGDGKELFFISADRKLMAVEVRTGSTFEPGIPKALFDLSTASLSANDTFAVTADGQRFIFVTQIRETAPSSLNVVVNWAADLKK